MRHQTRTRLIVLLVTVILLLAFGMTAQDTGRIASTIVEPIEGKTPKEVVDELWRFATQGQLLTASGWQRAGTLFTEPPIFKRPRKIFVVSNEWGPAGENDVTQDRAEAIVGYTSLGNIDNELRYTPVRLERNVQKEFYLYHLTTIPSYTLMYGPDGKTLLSKKPTGFRQWKIQDSRGLFAFTTVNTAIRYVLEQRDKAHDPVIKQNADRTLEMLKRLH